ncbi:MAG: glycosyltransferase family 2 protein [Rickettsiales bacterium]|jgi:glycosyltransferase involved in cell wall biosynthesis|nr:glycosyltransferase family 2 protein [Rickettsiales bacterium]
MQDPVISYVVTVYRKEPYVGYTVKSLLQQEGGLPSEYIFVDDVSPDRSLDVVEQVTQGIPNVTIIRNSENKGPSIRLNQGAKLARGRYLQFIDSDDIMAANASLTMLNLAQKHDADVVYGRWRKTDILSKDLLGTRMHDDAPYKVSDTPLDFQFNERILRMTQLVDRDTFHHSGGCDERVFIQDESIALRLARVAKRFVLIDEPVVLVPKIEGELSGNRSQLNHDRYLANRHMITDFSDLKEEHRRLFYRRCVSAAWKQVRDSQKFPAALFTRAFVRYMRTQLFLNNVNNHELLEMDRFFADLAGVRRSG